MHRLLPPLALLAALPILGGWSTPDHVIRYSSERGGSCTAMIPYYPPNRLWMAQWAGGRALDVSAERSFIDARAADACFFSREECESWLVRATGEFPARPGFGACRPLAPSPAGRGPSKG